MTEGHGSYGRSGARTALDGDDQMDETELEYQLKSGQKYRDNMLLIDKILEKNERGSNLPGGVVTAFQDVLQNKSYSLGKQTAEPAGY